MPDLRIPTLVLLLGATAPAAAGPVTLDHAGRLLDATGTPLTGPHTLTFTIWDAATGGTALYTEAVNVTAQDGYYSVTLGSGGGLDGSTLATAGLWLEIAADGTSLGRTPIGSVPRAAVADSVQGGVADVTELRINGVTVIDGGRAVARECPAGWTDLGPTCTKQPDGVARNYGDAVAHCYQQGARICNEQDHTFLCLNATALGLSYPDGQWYWTGTRSWERYSGTTYATHHVVRRNGTPPNGCWDNYSGGTTTSRISWDYGNTLRPVWCCRDK